MTADHVPYVMVAPVMLWQKAEPDHSCGLTVSALGKDPYVQAVVVLVRS